MKRYWYPFYERMTTSSTCCEEKKNLRRTYRRNILISSLLCFNLVCITMSKVGKKTIIVPAGVEVSIDATAVRVK